MSTKSLWNNPRKVTWKRCKTGKAPTVPLHDSLLFLISIFAAELIHDNLILSII